MSSDLGNILLALCGFGVVCCGSVLLVFLLLGRFTGRTMLLPAISMIGNMLLSRRDDNESDEDKREFRPSRPSSLDMFDAKRQDLDAQFDAAFEQHAGEQPPTAGIIRPPDSSGTLRSKTPDDHFDDFEAPSLRGRPRRDTRRSDRNDSDDEIFGGVLDDDGDGFPDF